MLYDTIEEYDQAIKETRDAISRIITTGEISKINSGDSTFETSEVKLASLRRHLEILISERNFLRSSSRNRSSIGFIRFRAGW